MLNDQRPYSLPKEAVPPANRRAIYLVVAVAILLTTIPVIFLVFQGWLSPENENIAEEVIVVEAEQEEDDVVTEEEIEENVIAVPVQTDPLIVTDSSITAIAVTPNDPAMQAVPPAIPADLPPVAPIPAVVPAVTLPPAPVVAATPSVVDKVAAPPAPAASSVAPKKSNKAPLPKREFRPLSAAELAKMKSANAPKSAANVTAKMRSDYNKKLYSFVRTNWSAPAVATVDNRKLKTTIELEVAANGTISNIKFKTPSYVKAMDDSVRKLISNLQKRKAPAPGFSTGVIKIELQN